MCFFRENNKKNYKKEEMDNKIQIQEYPIDTSITSVSVSVENFSLNATDCWLQVMEYDANNKFLNVSRVYVPPEIYMSWATDDDYLIEYCLSELGFIRKPELKVHFPE